MLEKELRRLMAPIPAWNSQGLIPPIDQADPVSSARSPYVVSLTDVIRRFATSNERIVILDGLLRYRAALHAINFTQGFQWLDGSFLEHVEMIEGRPPRDIDLVTFYDIPQGATQIALVQSNGALFDQPRVKATYHVDAYLVNLKTAPERLVAQSAYWYSMWSHRRSSTWKGYVQVNLAPTDDAAAIATLTELREAKEEKGEDV